VSAAPWGSASILPISWMYIAMMGAKASRQATEIGDPQRQLRRRRLAPHYPVLYAGGKRPGRARVHLDLRPIKDSDRHHRRRRRQAPDRLRLPRADHVVPGAGHADGRADRERIEGELDRFCDAMIAIRAEIAQGRGRQIGRAKTIR
jgi:glycine dehydrogenase